MIPGRFRRGELTFLKTGGQDRGKKVPPGDNRIPILYLAPWVDIGGSDTSTIDWFKTLDRTRFRTSLITTQPSPNRRLGRIAAYADELWELPQLFAGRDFPRFILSFIHTRGIRLLHIMNSRLGFELLPDVAALPDRPRVVVQFHGEEPQRAGYVRYVATRYGDLVDAFSVTTSTLGPHLDEYDIPAGKRWVIHIGVDAEHEFSPDHVLAAEGVQANTFHILFPARLTAQKDPLLMLDVATNLRASGLRFQIHVLGDGDLSESVGQSVRDRHLEREVILHGAIENVAPWYRACQAVMLTSAYETSPPRAVYEAMAMGLPAVVPNFPEMQELVVDGTGLLIDPRDRAAGYAEALLALAGDQAMARAIGDAGRARVCSRFTVERMAAQHASLYQQLLSRSPRPVRSLPAPTAGPAATHAVTLRDRHPGARALVSVIVTCYERGRYLSECLGSVTAQSHEPIEIVLVDDHSTDPDTLAALDDIDQRGLATVVRLPVNRGPAAARNAGIERAQGRYVLPLDDDDLLVPNAVAEMVEQLGSAGERIGFIYPSVQFFGSRTDFVEMPSYNLHALLDQNHCPVSCLFDREIFDHGLRYDEEITLGHEDWDFVLTLAEHGIHGEAARTKTLLCRKHGFSRSDLVEARMRFGDVLAARHPRLFAQREAIKASWNPALAVIALDPLSDAHELAASAAAQTCSDFELIVRSQDELGATGLAGRLRRIPTALAGSRAEALAEAVRASRGSLVLAVYGSTLDLLADRTLIERTLRILLAQPELSALGLVDAGPRQSVWRLLDGESLAGARLGALAWRTAETGDWGDSFLLDGQRPLDGLARWFSAHGTTQWRHFPGLDLGRERRDADGPAASVALGRPGARRSADTQFRHAPPALPQCPAGVPRRLADVSIWEPAQSRMLCRHREPASGHYVFNNSLSPPPGYQFDRALGCLRAFPLAGTSALALRADQAGFILDPSDADERATVLGFVEQLPLALFASLFVGREPTDGQAVLASDEDDPLAGAMGTRTTIGYIEPYPIGPPPPEAPRASFGLTGLVRTANPRTRRHHYGAGHVPPGLAAGELGALFTEPTGECEPLWIDPAGRVLTGLGMPCSPRPSLRTALRWAGDPLTWRGPFPMKPRLRATARRGVDATRLLTVPRDNVKRPSQPAGYLLRSSTSRTVELHVAVHPVTGDQLLTTEPSEARKLGYGSVSKLGHLIAEAPVTGNLGPLRPPAPWAARFGLVGLEDE